MAWVMMNDIEILMYTLGASFPVLSQYIVQRIDPAPNTQHSNFTSWARQIPDFFTHRTDATRSFQHRPANGRELTYVIELQSAEREREQEQAAARANLTAVATSQSFKSGPSEGPSEPESMCDSDLEKGALPTKVHSLR